MQYIPMNRRRRLYEGVSKILFEGSEPGTLIQHFKDETLLKNGDEIVLEGKGVLSNRISEHLFQSLSEVGIPNHFMKRLNMREQLLREVEILPLKISVHNRVSPCLAARLGQKEGSRLSRPLIEFYHKNEATEDQLVSEEHIFVFGWAIPSELDEIMTLATRTNDFLSGLFLGIGMRLMSFNFQVGRSVDDEGQRLIIADELSPETCHLQEVIACGAETIAFPSTTRDLGETYTYVAHRLGLLSDVKPAQVITLPLGEIPFESVTPSVTLTCETS
jgi:phosphoribosylaminoimidazole-succinocarboxamide synthase